MNVIVRVRKINPSGGINPDFNVFFMYSSVAWTAWQIKLLFVTVRLGRNDFLFD